MINNQVLLSVLLSLFLSSLITKCAARGNVAKDFIIPSDLIPTRMNLNGGWSPLVFNMTKSSWVANKFILTAPVPVIVLFSDAFCPGKMVKIYVNGSFLLDSSTVPLNQGVCSPRIPLPAGTFAFPDIFSHANFSLPAGEHEIAIKVIQNDPDLPTGIMYIRGYIPLLDPCSD